jgi:hypothetical protein
MVGLKTPIEPHSNITVLGEMICWAKKFCQVLYIPARPNRRLWVRFYDLSVALRIQKTTILVFTSSLNDCFLAKRKTLSLYIATAYLY